MAVAYRSFAHRSEALGTDPVVTKPTGTADGDLLIAIGVSNAVSLTAPAGWTTPAWSFDGSLPFFWKIASSEPASWTFPNSGSSNAGVAVYCFSGVDTSNPFNVTPSVGGGGGAFSLPSISPTTSCYVAQIVIKRNNTS